MTQNLISLTFNEAQLQAVDAALTELETQLGGLLAMDPAQKRSIRRMGEKSEAFCRQALRVLQQNPQMVPANVALNEATSDLATMDQLRPRMVRLSRLSERAADSDAMLGSDVISVALQAYGLLKVTGKTEGLASLRKELGARFAKSPRRTETKAA